MGSILALLLYSRIRFPETHEDGSGVGGAAMADGQEVDVLEEGLRAEERSAQLDEMRLTWRAEAEKAAQYFSAMPGFGHLPPEVPVGQPLQTGESSPDEPVSWVETTGTTTAQEDKISSGGLLVRLRQRLGRRPRTRQGPAERRAVAEQSQPESTPSEDPAVAEESQRQSKRFHSSF
jgi:hypothetical protein